MVVEVEGIVGVVGVASSGLIEQNSSFVLKLKSSRATYPSLISPLTAVIITLASKIYTIKSKFPYLLCIHPPTLVSPPSPPPKSQNGLSETPRLIF